MPAATASPAPHAASAAYCRQARRIRAQFRNDPARLQAALGELSRSANDRRRQAKARPTARSYAGAADLIDPTPARLFSSRVAAALGDGVLRYADRQDLLREAALMGIDRFEATLMIAAVQHGEPPRRSPRRTSARLATFRLRPYGLTLAALALQGVIASAAWWVVHA